MKRLILFLIWSVPVYLSGQSLHPDSLKHFQSGRYNLGGLVAYYFWEEDSLGKLISHKVERPYKRNDIIVINADQEVNEKLSRERVIAAVSQMSHRNEDVRQRMFDANPPVSGPDKIVFPLRKRPAQNIITVQYRRKNGVWESFTRKNVVYFNIYADSSKRYSHSNDSVVLDLYGLKRKAYGHYFVKSFWNDQQQLVAQQVFAYNGEEVTAYFTDSITENPCRILIFSNGYRGPKRNRDATDNLITRRDRYHYWMRLDRLFVHQLQPDEFFYIDGNNDISTSNHHSMANFTLSYSRVKSLRKKKRNADAYHLLNTEPNNEGFAFRREQGRMAGMAYLALRCNSPTCTETRDTIDVVCHSMGYAYALGFIETVQDHVVFGKMYIIAAENACADGYDWSRFEAVWQYGSNLDQANPDPVWQQDGIAPQCAVKGIDSVSVGGRVFLPANLRRKNFIDSHMLRQYHWIIRDLKPGDPGYVSR